MLKKCSVALAMAFATAHAFAADPVTLMSTTDAAQCTNPDEAGMRPVEVAQYYKLQSMGPENMAHATRFFYGKGLDQYGDLRLPPGKGPFPLAIVVHGGSWTAAVNGDYITPVATLLTKAGFATWNIEYSRLGSGGEWPGSFKSVGAAADYVRVLAKRYPIDLKRVISIGHSAGGQYALWLAGRHNIKPDAATYTADPLPLRGVISLDGTPDLAAFAALPRGKTVIPTLLGAPQADWRSHLAETSPVEMLPLGVPQYFLTENSDRLPSILSYIEKSKAAGDAVSYDIACPPSHFTTTDPTIPVVAKTIVKEARSLVNAVKP